MVSSLDAAYASCEHAARSHYENFPVASLLVPARMRRHIAALYAFARAADDMADEGARAAAERRREPDPHNNEPQQKRPCCKKRTAPTTS